MALLHRRAAEWLSGNGYVDAAVDHAMAAGNSDHAAALVQASWLRYFDAGLGTTVRGWLRTLESSPAAHNTTTVVTSAWMAAVSGQKEEMDRRLMQLSDISDGAALPDGTKSVESVVAMIHGLFGYDGPLDMLASARRATELEEEWQHAVVRRRQHSTWSRQLRGWRPERRSGRASQGRPQ